MKLNHIKTNKINKTQYNLNFESQNSEKVTITNKSAHEGVTISRYKSQERLSSLSCVSKSRLFWSTLQLYLSTEWRSRKTVVKFKRDQFK